MSRGLRGKACRSIAKVDWELYQSPRVLPTETSRLSRWKTKRVPSQSKPQFKNQMLIKNPSKLYFQGYFDENMELIPKVPKSPQEIEYEILEGRFGSTIASGMQKFLSWATLNLPLIYSNCIIIMISFFSLEWGKVIARYGQIGF